MPQPPTPRDGKVTRELVLAAALEIIGRDGTDALPMCRLAAALKRDTMALYRHAPGKAALLDGVVETVLAHPLACYDGTAELERGLDILSTGLAATLSLPGAGRPPDLAAQDAPGDLTDGVGER